jgi:mannose-6-phosphate isomerase-like protein (cupin superfamily)
MEEPMSATHIAETLQRFDASQGPRKVGREEGPIAHLGGCDARFLVWGEESGGGFSLVEHPIPPRSLCAPLHRHIGVDEYSFVLEGRMGALLGDEVIHAEAGELAFKPRDQWHTFWNAGDEPCRILEVISPAGFEHFFRELGEATEDGNFDPEALSERYGIEFQMESVPGLCERFGLTHPLLEMAG